MEDEFQEGVDVAPGGLTAEDEEQQRERRRLQDMAREAETLYGKPDAKLQKATKLVTELVEDGSHLDTPASGHRRTIFLRSCE